MNITEKMRSELLQAAYQFEEYARQHRLKKTEEGYAKATTNDRWARRMREAATMEDKMDLSSEIEKAWPGAGEIKGILIPSAQGELQCVVNNAGVTRIEKTVKAGEYSYIPYVRVWKGDKVLAEHCQHKLNSVVFMDEKND